MMSQSKKNTLNKTAIPEIKPLNPTAVMYTSYPHNSIWNCCPNCSLVYSSPLATSFIHSHTTHRFFFCPVNHSCVSLNMFTEHRRTKLPTAGHHYLHLDWKALVLTSTVSHESVRRVCTQCPRIQSYGQLYWSCDIDYNWVEEGGVVCTFIDMLLCFTEAMIYTCTPDHHAFTPPTCM